MTADLRRTPLFEEHVGLGAKIVPFAGYRMPIHYPAGITAEHHAVRRAAGLFDVSHMGEIEVSGPEALDLVQYVTTNDAAMLEVGQAQYSTLPREDGTLIDDLLVYRLEDRYMLVVNASNRERDFSWISDHARRFDARAEDRSDEIALLALQGPRAAEILVATISANLDSLEYYRFTHVEVSGARALVSRTGYTGEDGFELYVPADVAVPLWRGILEAGRSRGVVPAGLGARDSLRLEMGYALYGNDLDDTRTPLEAGLGWVTRLEKGSFIGRDALIRRKERGGGERLIGFRLAERGFPRPGYVLAREGEPIGTVTSGTLSPSLGTGIGMGYVAIEHAKPGGGIQVVIRDRRVAAEIVRPPFYRDGSLRR
jgi:aminomethyltransferase